MKKIGLKISICAIVTALALSSCLKDQDNSIQSDQDLAFITTVNDTKCAATSSGYVTSPEIQALTQEECYIIGYRLTTPPVNGIYTAEQVVNVSTTPLPQTALYEGLPANEQENNLAVEDLYIPFYFPTDFMGDRWLFKYSTAIEEGKNVTVRFYYNAANQIDKEGDDISTKNKIIIDVYFDKHDATLAETRAANSKSHLAIANLESLRTLYNPNFDNHTGIYNGKKYVNVQLLFRYHRYIDPVRPSEISYIGNWDSYSSVYMQFVENE